MNTTEKQKEYFIEQLNFATKYMQFSKKIALIGILGSLGLAVISLILFILGIEEVYLKSITETLNIYTTLGSAAVLGYMGNSGWEKYVRGKFNHNQNTQDESVNKSNG